MPDLESELINALPWLSRAAFRFCRDEVEASDLCGDTVCKILTYAGHYDPTQPFKPWALSIMANTYRTAYNRARLVDFCLLQDYDGEASDHTDNRVIVSDIRRAIRNGMKRSRTIRAVLLYAMGYDLREIADMESIPVGTVKSRMRDGRRLLKAMLID